MSDLTFIQWKNFAKTRQRASHLRQVQKSYLLGLPNISLSGLSAGLRLENRSSSPSKYFARQRTETQAERFGRLGFVVTDVDDPVADCR